MKVGVADDDLTPNDDRAVTREEPLGAVFKEQGSFLRQRLTLGHCFQLITAFIGAHDSQEMVTTISAFESATPSARARSSRNCCTQGLGLRMAVGALMVPGPTNVFVPCQSMSRSCFVSEMSRSLPSALERIS